jgi:hypothetical protein
MKAKGFSQRKRFIHKRPDSRPVFSGLADLRGRPFGIAVRFRFADGVTQPFEFSPGGYARIPVHLPIRCPGRGSPGISVYVEIIDVTSESFDGRSDGRPQYKLPRRFKLLGVARNAAITQPQHIRARTRKFIPATVRAVRRQPAPASGSCLCTARTLLLSSRSRERLAASC